MLKLSGCQRDTSIAQEEADSFIWNIWLKHLFLLRWIKRSTRMGKLWGQRHCLMFWGALQVQTAPFPLSLHLHICKWLQGRVEGAGFSNRERQKKSFLLLVFIWQLWAGSCSEFLSRLSVKFSPAPPERSGARWWGIVKRNSIFTLIINVLSHAASPVSHSKHVWGH